MRLSVSLFVCLLSGFSSRVHATEDRLKEGAIHIEAVSQMADIRGKWEEVGGGCVDLRKSRLAIYLPTIGGRSESLELSERSYENIVTNRFSECGSSIIKGHVQVRSYEPTLTLDFIQPSRRYQCDLVPRFNDYRFSGIELYRAQTTLLMTSSQLATFCRMRPGTTYVVFWRQADQVYAF